MRRLFGGAGLYADGVMFAILSKDVIYLKADDGTRAAFEREGCAPFSYQAKGGKRAIMSYWRMPERLYDDPDELAVWAETGTRGCAALNRGEDKTQGTERGEAGEARCGMSP